MFSYFQALLLKMCIFKQYYFLLVFTYPISSLFQSYYVYIYKINLFDGAFIFPLRNHYYDNWKCVFFCFHGSYCQGNKSIHHNQVGYLPKLPLREKCLNTEIFLVRIFLYSFRIQGNTDQKKLRIWTLFTLCTLTIKHPQTDRNYSKICWKGVS